MPIYTYECNETGERVEEIFLHWGDAPDDFERRGLTFRKVPSVPARGIVMSEGRYELKRLAKKGIVPRERGMDQDAKNARKAIERKQAAARREHIAEMLAPA